MDTSNILVIVAHPDDEVIGCGGTLARLVDEGHRVQVMYLTAGETSSGHERTEETIQVAEKLGFEAPLHCGIPDQQLDTYAQSSINNMIKETVQSVKPNIIYTHAKEDLNIDHRIVHDSVMVACRPVHDCSVTELYTFQGSPWDFGEFGEWRANTYVNIQSYIDKKMEAMSVYSSEVKESPHPQALESMRYTYLANGVRFCLNEVEEFKQVFRLV
jgi:LmbE family N-acetylglucosaminyl deacetylase